MPDEPTTTVIPDAETVTDDRPQPSLKELQAALDELGLTPGQIKGRLEASKTNEKRAKENAEAAKELAALKVANQTESEKALAQAREEGKQEGKKEATDQWSSQAINAEFKAAFAERDFDVDAFLETANTAKFLTDDGQINSQAIQELADKLAPKQQPSTAYVQGKHQTPTPLNDGNALTQSVMAALGGS